jgi:hypothetical protein
MILRQTTVLPVNAILSIFYGKANGSAGSAATNEGVDIKREKPGGVQ